MTYPQDPQGGYYQQQPQGGYPQQPGYPPQGGMTTPVAGQQYKGFFSSLFDFTFKSFVTPKVIQIYYVVALIVIGLAGLGMLLSFLISGEPVLIIIGIIVVPLVIFIYLLLVRMGLELVANIFRIGENIQAMRDRADGK
ncbi:DUF4282 domain-containing protein [Stackebrandtia soli]|uniref:DUF4282 domain-containing protein n=1 Tax=Stackebrandtia soli TaxID=1892856 RepID=UPI0039EBF6F9